MESDLHSDLWEWIADHLAADWTTVTQLRMEESKKDPPEEPFRSLYTARELLSGMRAKLDACPLKELEDFTILSCFVALEMVLPPT
ncbi:uncharacterized protein LOC135347069 isoform X3 [Halichondria panicea]